jgi:hypothetical protein
LKNAAAAWIDEKPAVIPRAVAVDSAHAVVVARGLERLANLEPPAGRRRLTHGPRRRRLLDGDSREAEGVVAVPDKRARRRPAGRTHAPGELEEPRPLGIDVGQRLGHQHARHGGPYTRRGRAGQREERGRQGGVALVVREAGSEVEERLRDGACERRDGPDDDGLRLRGEHRRHGGGQVACPLRDDLTMRQGEAVAARGGLERDPAGGTDGAVGLEEPDAREPPPGEVAREGAGEAAYPGRHLEDPAAERPPLPGSSFGQRDQRHLGTLRRLGQRGGRRPGAAADEHQGALAFDGDTRGTCRRLCAGGTVEHDEPQRPAAEAAPGGNLALRQHEADAFGLAERGAASGQIEDGGDRDGRILGGRPLPTSPQESPGQRGEEARAQRPEREAAARAAHRRLEGPGAHAAPDIGHAREPGLRHEEPAGHERAHAMLADDERRPRGVELAQAGDELVERNQIGLRRVVVEELLVRPHVEEQRRVGLGKPAASLLGRHLLDHYPIPPRIVRLTPRKRTTAPRRRLTRARAR